MHNSVLVLTNCNIELYSSHPANIRIKSPNMSTQHIKIHVDENGKVSSKKACQDCSHHINAVQRDTFNEYILTKS